MVTDPGCIKDRKQLQRGGYYKEKYNYHKETTKRTEGHTTTTKGHETKKRQRGTTKRHKTTTKVNHNYYKKTQNSYKRTHYYYRETWNYYKKTKTSTKGCTATKRQNILNETHMYKKTQDNYKGPHNYYKEPWNSYKKTQNSCKRDTNSCSVWISLEKRLWVCLFYLLILSTRTLWLSVNICAIISIYWCKWKTVIDCVFPGWEVEPGSDSVVCRNQSGHGEITHFIPVHR